MKIKVFIIFTWFIINPIYGQINFNEKVNIYDVDSLSNNVIYDDFDNDNDIDLIKYVTSNQRNVLLQKNENGNLNATLPKSISNGVSPIISLDINNDSYPDLITYHSFNTIGVLPNLQNDTFGNEQTLISFSGSYTISPIKFDYNSDGFIDLIVRDNQNNAYVLLNNQNGGFLSQQFLFALGSPFTSIYKIDDFDNDGDFDLYILGNPNLEIYINNNGNFVNLPALNTAAAPFKEFGILDINRNGYKDILYWKNGALWVKYFGLNTTTNQIVVLNDLPVVQNIPFYTDSNNSRSVYIKGIGPGIYDVYIALESTQNQSNIHKFTINNGVFSTAEIVLPNFNINVFTLNNYIFSDLNNSGKVDFLFSSNFNSQNMVLVNYDIDNLSDKTICYQQTINTDNFTVIDMNGDGVEDVCIGQQNGLGYYKKMINNQHGAIKNLIGVMSNPNAASYTLNYIMDFDNDGLGDVIDYSDSGMYAKVFKNLGNDNFLYLQNVSILVLTSGMYFADIDNDGFKDLLFQKNSFTTGNELMWSKNNNGSNFGNVQPISFNYPNTIDTTSLAFGDINNNGTSDILMLSNYYSNNSFNYEIILIENQNGIFSATSIATLIDDYSGGNIKIKDMDQDGDLDFFVLDINVKPFLFYRNDGQNNFYKIIIDNINIHDIEFDDNDGDGKYEIFATNYNSNSYSSDIFYYKTSNFTNFTKFEIDSFGTYYQTRADILLFDYNSDNKKDLFVNKPNFVSGQVSVYINSSNTLTVNEITNSLNLKMYPNPFTDTINWTGENNVSYKLQLFALDGKFIHEEKTLNNKIDFSFLERGIYLLVIENLNLHSKSTYKIIKE
ncbi:T9SS type A sorting domain-containing protein [Flavobacterium sp. XS2P24]|uniref:T9SS type A sorting domain-containing protein n=1 Tax=Flavobacterium sp. XS2P24 TaxID=3041249 RepID=UPI0024A8EE3B|nr:T9SS type A sorting domain-containing protein [Flavobacterium sp. XS2P24]MDI6051246.1 T9SS type A sorting domain-containing protein [Flavobacterium sp. XS2P24]